MSSGKGKNKNTLKNKHSLLRKFCTFILIAVILTSIISGVIMYFYITDYLTKSKSDDLKKAVDDVNTLYSRMYTTYINNLDENGDWVSEEGRKEYLKYYTALLDRLELYNKILNVYGYITESDGSIFLSYPLLPNMTDRSDTAGRDYMPAHITKNLVFNNNEYFFRNGKQYYTGSDSKYVVNTGDFYGLYDHENASYLSVTQSIAYTYPGLSESINKGSITLSVPFPEITAARNHIIYYFIIATLISVIIEVVILVITTKEITEPIRVLTNATKQVTEGNLSIKVHSESKDEIGELVNSYNVMIEALSNLDIMRNDFIASVSHELRTPMTSIGGFIDGILDGVIPLDKHDYYLQIIKEEITRMNVLVNDLLNMARLQSGKVELDYMPCKCDDLIFNTVVKLEPFIEQKNINIEFDLNAANCEVLIDKPSIERVIINLVQNAIKFTPEGGSITLHSSHDDSDTVQIIIEDTGEGIKADELPFIFEKFYKVDKSRGLDKKGTGLGLSIVKSILAAHKQSIRVESTVGKGSRFIFTLPIYRKEHF